MGSKCKLIICLSVLLAVVVVVAVIICVIIHTQNKDDYNAKLVSVMNEQNETMVKNIFSFEFDRAYILNDCYISGEGFTQKYNLDISISEVKAGTSENIQRIVFVDNSGNFVYEFKCDNSKVLFSESGIIIYPETKIKANSVAQEKPLEISFQSVEHYDS